ncbi:hypothetical protein [Aeromonas salmonicida]
MSTKDIALILDDDDLCERNDHVEKQEYKADSVREKFLSEQKESAKNKINKLINSKLNSGDNISDFTVKVSKYNKRQMDLIGCVLPRPYSCDVVIGSGRNENNKYVVELFNQVKNVRRIRIEFKSQIKKFLRRDIINDISQLEYTELIDALCENYLIEDGDICQFVNDDIRKANFVWTMLKVLRVRFLSNNAKEKDILDRLNTEREFGVSFRRRNSRQQDFIESSLGERSNSDELKNGGASVKDLVKNIINQFDSLVWETERQKVLLSAIKIKWDFVNNDKRMVKWVESNATILEWAWGYIVTHFFNGRAPVWAIDVGERNYGQVIITTFDVIDGNAKELLLDKIKIYGRQYKARPNLKNKPSSYYLSDNARDKLSILSEKLGKNKSETIEFLIIKAFEKEC